MRIVDSYRLKLELEDRIGQTAKQLAHDIRSPLSALNIISQKLKGNDAEAKLINDVVSRINGIANDLLSQSKAETLQLSSNSVIGKAESK